MALSADGKLVASGDEEGELRSWDVDHRKELWRAEGHAGRVYAVAFSPDETRLATAGGDKLVNIWDLSGRKIGGAERAYGSRLRDRLLGRRQDARVRKQRRHDTALGR